ncbi:MAG TPA: hypothetical protein VNN22_19990 [Verrucomicrobiae bacterium]|nr:hypothetical protein [Verrucomicrobiae bacterium]
MPCKYPVPTIFVSYSGSTVDGILIERGGLGFIQSPSIRVLNLKSATCYRIRQTTLTY